MLPGNGHVRKSNVCYLIGLILYFADFCQQCANGTAPFIPGTGLCENLYPNCSGLYEVKKADPSARMYCFQFESFLKSSKFNGWQLAKMKKSIPDMSLP